MKLNPKTLALASFPLPTVRVAWYAWPSMWLGAFFWAASLLVILGWSVFLRRRAIPRHSIVLAGIGATLNALVVLTNGGYMPVHGKSIDFQEGIWRSAEQGGNFLFLGDRMSWGGASPGDFVLAAGVALGLSIAVTRAAHALAQRRRAIST